MELYLDTANLNLIKKALEIYPITGVTTNPSILKRENPKDFYGHLKAIRSLIGPDRPLHVQVVSDTAEGMIEDAHAILKHLDSKVFVKIPVTQEGLKAIRILKKEGVKITTTAITTTLQAHLAVMAGADMIAPYFNRMLMGQLDPVKSITSMQNFIDNDAYPTQILAASFKTLDQVNDAIDIGIAALTLDPALLDQVCDFEALSKTVTTFKADFESCFGIGKTPSSL